MSLLFSPLKIGPITIKNRFMRSATYEALANPDGTPKKRLLHMMEHLSEGQVGLIIPGFVYPMESGKAQPRQTALYVQILGNLLSKQFIKTSQNLFFKFVMEVFLL